MAGQFGYRREMSAQTVSVGYCYSIAEAMMIRSFLEARGIIAIIPGMGAVSALAYTSGFASQVLVDRDHAEDAVALIRQLREGASAEDEVALAEGEARGDGATEGEDDGEGEGEGEDEDEDPAVVYDVEQRVARRRRIAITACAATMVTLGMGHMVNRAYLRGVFFAGLEVLGLYLVALGVAAGKFVLIGAIATDLAGGLALATSGAPRVRAALPVARVSRGSRR